MQPKSKSKSKRIRGSDSSTNAFKTRKGRHMIQDNRDTKRVFSVSMPNWLVDKIDEERDDIPRSTFISKMLSTHLEEKEMLENAVPVGRRQSI